MKKTFFALLLLSGCHHNHSHVDTMVAIQISDRNGITETISNPDRLVVYEQTDFFSSQPYQKVLRVYRNEGKNHSKITTYHPNGAIHQYLEAEEMRAHGAFREWHSNGLLKIEASVIGGTADITAGSQKDWLFDGTCRVWSESGILIGEIVYEKGVLQGKTRHYYETGQLKKELPYTNHLLDGEAVEYYPHGTIKSQFHFQNDLQHGPSIGFFENGEVCSREHWIEGRLAQGFYYDLKGSPIAGVERGEGFRVLYDGKQVTQWNQIKNGVPEGSIKTFNIEGKLKSSYEIKDGKKHGDEIIYFPDMKPKMQIHWSDDAIHGLVKTWYDNGQIRSEREYNRNKKMGSSFAWYRNGSLMHVEEYEEDLLTKGRYYKKGNKDPISTIQNGTGVAHLYDEEGILLRKVLYQKGRALDP